jgi:two-component system, chemotaxis family, chemotaxis protein CheY
VLVARRRKREREIEKNSQLTACMAHDLLTPLSGIELSLHLFKDDQDFQQKLSQRHRHGMKSVEACSDMIQEICINVRSMCAEAKSSFAQSLMTGHLERVNVNNLVCRLHAVIEPIKKHVPINIAADDDVPEEIIADSSKIFRCAMNYLIIACKRTTRGMVALRLVIRRDLDYGRNALLFVTCEDTAPPIKLNMYDHLFRLPTQGMTLFNGEFLQEDRVHESICPELCLLSVACEMNVVGGEYGFRPRNEGDMGCEEYDKRVGAVSGSMFWFCVPCSEFQDAKVAQTMSSDSPIHDSRHQAITREVAIKLQQSINGELLMDRQKRVLVIEDSKVVRKMLTKILTTLEFDVSQAENGMEGLEKLKGTLFDLTLCDFLMPIMDGFDCVQQYRDWEKYHRPWITQRIIGISAHATPGDIERGMKVGMDDCRIKPITFKVLSQLVECEEQVQMSNHLDAIERRKRKAICVKNERSLASRRMSQTSLANGQFCTCLVIAPQSEEEHINLIQVLIKSFDWHSTIARTEGEVLTLLKMRMWDLVLVDDTFAPAISAFRNWESKKRKIPQNRITLMTKSIEIDMVCPAQLPEGIDAVILKPLCLNSLEKIIHCTGFSLGKD